MTLLRVLPKFKVGYENDWSDKHFTPDVDIYEDENTFNVVFDLPGMEKDKISISVKDDILSVSGERKTYDPDNDTYYRHYERKAGTFSRSFRLTKHIDSEHIKGSYESGVLTVKLPKKEEARKRTIDIK